MTGPNPPLHEQAQRGTVASPKGNTGEALERSPFPTVYTNLAEVFSEEDCEVLPPQCPTDCVIELIPEAELPKPRMYSMMQKEMGELRQYIDKNLTRGFI